MSVPVNPLDRFRSYAYHHILVAAGSTEAIRAFTTGEGEVLKNLKLGQTAGGQGSEYYLVFDTRKNVIHRRNIQTSTYLHTNLECCLKHLTAENLRRFKFDC